LFAKKIKNRGYILIHSNNLSDESSIISFLRQILIYAIDYFVVSGYITNIYCGYAVDQEDISNTFIARKISATVDIADQDKEIIT